MNIGELHVCLRVADAAESVRFYQRLGFASLESGEGWAVVGNGECRLGLFEPEFMKEQAFSLNFRGGHMAELASSLSLAGIEPLKPPKIHEDGSGSISLTDPDGHVVFLDSTTEEVAYFQNRLKNR